MVTLLGSGGKENRSGGLIKVSRRNTADRATTYTKSVVATTDTKRGQGLLPALHSQ